MNKLANPDNWMLVYAEDRDEHLWAYVGPEPQPWKLAEQATDSTVSGHSEIRRENE